MTREKIGSDFWYTPKGRLRTPAMGGRGRFFRQKCLSWRIQMLAFPSSILAAAAAFVRFAVALKL